MEAIHLELRQFNGRGWIGLTLCRLPVKRQMRRLNSCVYSIFLSSPSTIATLLPKEIASRSTFETSMRWLTISERRCSLRRHASFGVQRTCLHIHVLWQERLRILTPTSLHTAQPQ